MGRLRATAAIAAVVTAISLLSGCVPVNEESGSAVFTDRQRTSIRTSILDSKWSSVAAEYPEAIRPEVTMMMTTPDHDWPDAMVECLRLAGIVAHVVNGNAVYGSAGQSPLDVAVSFYSCQAEHPAESQVASYFTPAQSAALYDYYLGVVRPCLLTAGAPSPASPDRSAAVGLAGLAGWNPYQVIWTSTITAQTRTYFEQRCPPTPSWLNLTP